MDLLDILGRIGFDWRVFLFNLFNFVLLALLLKKFFFSKIIATIDERQKLIDAGLKDAQQAKLELEESSKKRAEIIQESKKEGAAMVKAAVDKAQMEAQQVKLEVEKDIEASRKKNEDSMTMQRAELVANFKSEAADIVMIAAQKLLQERGSAVKTEDVTKILSSIELKK